MGVHYPYADLHAAEVKANSGICTELLALDKIGCNMQSAEETRSESHLKSVLSTASGEFQVRERIFFFPLEKYAQHLFSGAFN